MLPTKTADTERRQLPQVLGYVEMLAPAVKVETDDAVLVLNLMRRRLAVDLEADAQTNQNHLHRSHEEIDDPSAPAVEADAQSHVYAKQPRVLSRSIAVTRTKQSGRERNGKGKV